MPLDNVEVGNDLTPRKLSFDLSAGEELSIAGIANLIVREGRAKIEIIRPKSLRVSAKRKGKGGEPAILPLPIVSKSA